MAFIVVCCCCLTKSTDLIENKYDVETNAGEMYDDLSEENDKSELNQSVKPKSAKSRNERSENGTELKDISKIKENNGSGKNLTSETSMSTPTTATPKTTTSTTKVTIEKETIKAPKISINPAKESTSKTEPNSAELKEDQGYQASLRYLLERPQAGSEPSSRPLSAMTVDQGIYRSGSALNFGRQSSLSLLVPRDMPRPSSANNLSGRRSPNITGPYLSDPSNLKFVQMRAQQQLSPKTSFIFDNDIFEEETSFTIEPERKKSEVKKKVESEKKKKEKVTKKQKRSDSVGSGIEEIKLVQAAVKAFKRKTR